MKINNTVKTSEECAKILKSVGLSPTHHRCTIMQLLCAEAPFHFTAEEIHEKVKKTGFHISLATIYNTLRAFTLAKLLNLARLPEITGAFFDTNTEPHGHFWDDENKELVDFSFDDVRFEMLPEAPKGKVINSIDMTIRLK